MLIIVVLFLALFSQEQDIAVLDSTSLKQNIFLDLWRKLKSTENDLREVKDQVYNITTLYEIGSEREGERAEKRCKVSLFTECCVIAHFSHQRHLLESLFPVVSLQNREKSNRSP